jgi:hypothetical protein
MPSKVGDEYRRITWFPVNVSAREATWVNMSRAALPVADVIAYDEPSQQRTVSILYIACDEV